MPPGSAKTTSASILFSPRYLSHAPGDRLARARNVLAASHTTELAARFGRGLLLGYLKPRQPCASRDAGACVERAADPLNSGRIDAKPCSDLAHALCAPRLVQSLADSLD